MKKINKCLMVLWAVVLIALIFPFSVSASPVEDDRTIFGESYTLESGNILDGNLVVIGGVVDIEEGATVDGNVIAIGSVVTIDGTVKYNLTAVGGTVSLLENAVIEGDIISPVSVVSRAEGAILQGDYQQAWSIPWTNLNLPNVTPSRSVHRPMVNVIPVFTSLARIAGMTLVMVALGALLLLVMPKATEVMTGALIAKPWHILGYGALTALVMLVGGFLLVITICLIPVAVLAGLAFGLAVLAGWLALGYELGKRMAASIFKTTWHPVLAAVLGNLVLYLLAKGLDMIPCLGGFLVFIAALFGLGMAVVTLFGTNRYPRNGEDDSLKQEVLFDKAESIEGEPPVIETATVETPQLEPEKPIDALELDTRLTNVLNEAGITTVEQLLTALEAGDQRLLDISGFGSKSLSDLKKALRQKGYDVPKAE
jgi:hypothetical protein